MDNKPLVKVPLKYGIAGGVISIILFLTLYFSDGNPLTSIRVFDFILLPIFIFFSIKEVRDYHWGGKIAYWQGMTAGLFCYMVIALISGLFIWVFLEKIDPAVFVQHKQENIAILTGDQQNWVEQLGSEGYEQALEDVSAMTPFSLAADDFIKKLLIGFFMTSLIAIFLKRS